MKTKNETPVTATTPEPEKIAGLSEEVMLDVIQLMLLKQRQEDREEAEKKRLAGF